MALKTWYAFSILGDDESMEKFPFLFKSVDPNSHKTKRREDIMPLLKSLYLFPVSFLVILKYEYCTVYS